MTEKFPDNPERSDEGGEVFALGVGRDALILRITSEADACSVGDNVVSFREGRKRLRPEDAALDEAVNRHPAGKGRRRPSPPDDIA